MRIRIETSTVALRTLVLSVVLLAGCAAPREAVQPPGAAPAPSETRVPPTAPIARIEPGGHTAAIQRIDTDAAGRVLVTGSLDKTVRLWSIPAGTPMKTLRVPISDGNEGKVFAVAISPDGGTVAAAGWTGYEWDGSGSIYLFDVASGRLVKRLAGLPGGVNDLSYSADGLYLAAGLGGPNGIRVYRTADWEPVHADPGYGDDCYSVDFAVDGRLVSMARDGWLRLYAPEDGHFRRTAEEKATGGKEPYTVRFSPDGTQIAVGFVDTTAVDVLDGKTLAFKFAPETRGVDNGNLSTVSWSRDGRYLYAGGTYTDESGFGLVRRWDESGRGPYRDLPASRDTIMGLESLEGGRLVYGAADPAFGVFDEAGRKVLDRPSEIADLRGIGARFLLSRDGRTVQFGFWSGRPARFSLDARRIDTAPGEDAALRPPRTEAPGIRITDWYYTREPKLNGTPLALWPREISCCLAIDPEGTQFILGTGWALRLFDAQGRSRGLRATLSGTWSVNIAGNGEVAVAAFADGTVRWYRINDGQELLAFFPHPDGQRWVLWNPEGFFDAAPGAEGLVGFHLNRGPDAAAEFVSAAQLADLFYRPDLVTAYLDGNEKAIAEAKEKGALARFRTRDLGTVLASGLPPELELLEPAEALANGRDFRLRFRVSDRGGRRPGRIPGERRRDRARQGAPAGGGGAARDLQPGIHPPGRNEIEAVVYNEKGTVQSRAVAVAVQLSTAEVERPALYVLAVGVDQYWDSALALHYAAGDAKAFADTLVRQGEALFAPGEVIVLPDRDATRTGIEKAFLRLSARVQPSDVFVLYLAGHGRSFDGRYHFLPSEAIYENEESLRQSGLSEEDLKGLLQKVRAQKSLVVLDTCQAGAGLGLAALATTRGPEMKDAIFRLMKTTGRAVLAATTDKDVAFEGYKEHGVFTYALLEGLRGAADRPERDGRRDGVITIDELSDYLQQEVPRITLEKFHKEIFPMRSVEGNSFPIGGY